MYFSCTRKNPAKNCVEIEDVETIENNILDEYNWVVVSHLDAALRPVGLFIATMEASEKLTSSLVIPMTLAILHAKEKMFLFIVILMILVNCRKMLLMTSNYVRKCKRFDTSYTLRIRKDL